MTTLIDNKTKPNPETTPEKAKLWRLKTFCSPLFIKVMGEDMPSLAAAFAACHIGNDLYMSARCWDSEDEAMRVASMGHALYEAALEAEPRMGLTATDFYFVEAVPEDAS